MIELKLRGASEGSRVAARRRGSAEAPLYSTVCGQKYLLSDGFTGTAKAMGKAHSGDNGSTFKLQVNELYLH